MGIAGLGNGATSGMIKGPEFQRKKIFIDFKEY